MSVDRKVLVVRREVAVYQFEYTNLNYNFIHHVKTDLILVGAAIYLAPCCGQYQQP